MLLSLMKIFVKKNVSKADITEYKLANDDVNLMPSNLILRNFIVLPSVYTKNYVDEAQQFKHAYQGTSHRETIQIPSWEKMMNANKKLMNLKKK